MNFRGTITDCIEEIEKKIKRQVSHAEIGNIIRIYFDCLKHPQQYKEPRGFFYTFSLGGKVNLYSFVVLDRNIINLKEVTNEF